MGEGKREMEMEEHTCVEKEGNEEKVKEEEEEGHAAVIFQGSTYLFFSCFFLFLGGGRSCLRYVLCMHVCMQQVLSCYIRVVRFGEEKKGNIEDWRLV